MKYYIKATMDNMTAAYDGYQYKMGVNKHPDPDTSNRLCSRGFHLACTPKDALVYTPGATELYLCTARKVYARSDNKLRCGEVNILWRIPMPEEFSKARAAFIKARDAFIKALAAPNTAWAASKARAASDKAWAVYIKAWAASNKARAALGEDFMAAVIKQYESEEKK